MLDDPSAGLHQPLLQAGQRPLPDPRGQRQPSPQIPEVISNQAQPQPHLVSAKAMTRTASIASKPMPISPFRALYQIGSSLRYLEIRVKIIAAMTPGALAA